MIRVFPLLRSMDVESTSRDERSSGQKSSAGGDAELFLASAIILHMGLLLDSSRHEQI